MRRLAFAVVACLLALFASAFVLTSARWSGHFTLRIILKLPDDVDRDSIGYVECWNENEARWLCEDNSELNHGFTPAYRSDPDADLVSVSSGGSSDVLGFSDSYHQPAYLVLQYRYATDDGSGSPHRVCVPIPTGRGDRTTSLDLTHGGG